MGRYLRLMIMFLRVSIQDDAAYRVDFLVQTVIAVLQLVAELAGLWIIFSNTVTLNGWDAWQMLALMGVFRVMSGVIGLGIAPNMRSMMEDVRSGTLDFVLLKPVSSQFYVSVRRVVLWRMPDILIGLTMAVVATVKMRDRTGADEIGLFVLMLGAGVIIIYSFWLGLATLAFWLTRISNIEMVFWNVFEAGRYPVDIYRPWIRWGLTYVVPLAFLTTFPAGMLVGKGTPSGLVVAWLAAAAALTGATLFWRFGVRRYSGASA